MYYIFSHSCTYTTFQIKTVFNNVLFSTEVHNPLHAHLLALSHIYIWLSAKRCVCNRWLGCVENKRCLKKYVVMNVGWMCVKMNEDIVEIIAAEILKWFGKYVWLKCDFTDEIQPQKMDSGTEPVSVGVIWLKETRESYIYHIYYVSKRSFYRIHASERLPLNYAFVKSISNFIWSDFICATIRNANFRQQSENNSDPWHKRKWHHMHIRLVVNHLAALKRFNQTTFVTLTKSAAPQILSQYMFCEQKTKFIGLHLSTNTKAPHDTSRSHLIWMAWKESSAENIERYVAIIVMRLLSDHSWRPITILHHLFYVIS